MNKEEFDKYYSNFDNENGMINRKYYHTFRVVDYAEKIAICENLNGNDIELAKTCALLHDIARFKQATEYNTYIDADSFDHGDVGYEILKENDYVLKYTSEENKNIVLEAVKNHNKFEIDNNLNDKEKYFSKITRDADKLDIMFMQCNDIVNDDVVNKNAYNSVLNEQMVLNQDCFSNSDSILRMLAWVYDMNFKESFKIIKEKDIINKKIEILKESNKEYNFDILQEKINKYIDERID